MFFGRKSAETQKNALFPLIYARKVVPLRPNDHHLK